MDTDPTTSVARASSNHERDAHHDRTAHSTHAADSHEHGGGGEAQHHVPTGYSPSTWLGAAAFVIVLAAALGFFYVRGERARSHSTAELQEAMRHDVEAPEAVDVVLARTSPAQTVLTLPGEARSFYETTIFARTSGYLSKWYVDIGDPVNEGQVLATIETPELDDQLTAANAKLGALQSEVAVAQTEANFAEVSFGRWEKLAPGGAVSHQERDQKKAELDTSDAKLKAAESQVALGQAEVKRLMTLESFKNVRAPFGGIITQRHVDPGALVTAGSTTNTTPLFSISKADQIRVRVQVPPAAVSYMKHGMPVTATAREFPGQTFTGKLDRTSGAEDPTSKELTVEVLVPNKDLTLLPGMYLQVKFQNTRTAPPVRVPAGAVCFRADGPQVAVVGPKHHIHFRSIQIAEDLGDYVELAGGVKADEQVVLNVSNDVNTGDLVDPHPVDGAAPPPATGHSKPAAAEPTRATAEVNVRPAAATEVH